MASMIRNIFLLFLLFLSFLGGWFSSGYVRQDPFLASLLPSGISSSSAYDRFIADLRSILENGTFENPGTPENQGTPTETQMQEDMPGTDVKTPSPGGAPQGQLLEVNRMIDALSNHLTSKEKLSFFIWAGSRFNETEMKEITQLLEEGLTEESFLKIYEIARRKLRPEDYAYLFSFFDRYLALQEEKTVPVFRSGETGAVNSLPQ
ncbi:hypothetical protein [Thermicanus aegyptius]|uniref:hypothetical protein n=1 Tax=Thermicanus aegyptius TaxID=94009 RepID=UPI0004124942|nr:hypothetical protein [Thermicanus aegyptius]